MNKITNALLTKSLFLRAAQFSKGKMVQTVGFKNENIHNFKKISYIPKNQLQFIDGKALLYSYERTYAEAFRRSLFYTIPLSSLAYLIITNPFSTFFPAAIPILTVLEIILLKFFFTRIKWNQKIVKKIYLLESGDVTEIYYANEKKRTMFGQPLKSVYYNSVFVNPDFQKEQGVMDINLFPSSLKEFKDPKNQMKYSWTKFYSNGENFIIIPKKANYINPEILIEIFNGKIIKTEL